MPRSALVAWTLILFCWFSPSSRWQSISFAGVYLIILSRVHWRQFSAFAALNSYAIIAVLIAWLTISALSCFSLSRRKSTPSSSGLN
jgi:amino acid transporter